MSLLAQIASSSPDYSGIIVQGGAGAIALIMLRWFMTKNDARLQTMAEAQDRFRNENAASNEKLSREVTASNERMGREIAASNDRMGRAHLMLVLALDGVNEAAKIRTKAALAEIEDSLKANEKSGKP